VPALWTYLDNLFIITVILTKIIFNYYQINEIKMVIMENLLRTVENE